MGNFYIFRQHLSIFTLDTKQPPAQMNRELLLSVVKREFCKPDYPIFTVQCFTDSAPGRVVYTPVLVPGAPTAQTL